MRSTIVLFACFYDDNFFIERIRLPKKDKGRHGGFRLCTASA